MKNLKRALSLVLSAAMMVGMMVVGTGAAYADVTAEHNEEAIAVVAAAGIMGAGDSFNPDAELTRGEMAVIMVNMLDLDVKDFKGASNFTDAGWAVDYIDACYANGIMAGVSATEFGTNVKVTTVQAALMMLKALGYFEEAKLNDWMLDTIKMASKIDLLDGIEAKANANLTRNEVAQLALNALEATMVEETANGANTSIKGEGFEITVDSNVTREELLTSYNYNGATPDGNGKTTKQLIEDLFGNDILKDSTGEYTDLGEPAHKWTAKIDGKVETLITVAEDAMAIIIADKAVTGITNVYKEFVDEDYTTVGADAIANLTYNGTTSWSGNVTDGDMVAFYDLNDNGQPDKAVMTRFSLGKITDVTTNLTKAQKEDGNTLKATLKAVDATGTTTTTVGTFLDKDFADYDYAKNDYVLYVKNGSKIVASLPVVTVTGEVAKTVNGGAKIVVDGETYKLVNGASAGLNDKGTFYLNIAGQVMAADTTAAKSNDYAYIYAIDVPGTVNAQGFTSTQKVAYMVLADGTLASYPVAKDADCSANATINAASTYAGMVAYAIKDGELHVKTPTNGFYQFSTETVNKNDAVIGTYYATSDTEFVFVDVQTANAKVKTSVATGYKNVSVTGQTIWAEIKDGKVLTAFVVAANGALASDVVYGVLLDTDYTQYKVDTTTYTTFNVSVDGADTTLTFKGSDGTTAITNFVSGSTAEGAVFGYKMVDGYAQLVGTPDDTFALVTVSTSDYFVAGSMYKLNDEVEYFTVTVEYEDDTKAVIEDVTVVEGATIAKDDYVKVIMDGTDVAIVYVLVEVM